MAVEKNQNKCLCCGKKFSMFESGVHLIADRPELICEKCRSAIISKRKDISSASSIEDLDCQLSAIRANYSSSGAFDLIMAYYEPYANEVKKTILQNEQQKKLDEEQKQQKIRERQEKARQKEEAFREKQQKLFLKRQAISNIVVTTADIKEDYDIIGPVYVQVSNKGFLSSTFSNLISEYEEELRIIKNAGQISSSRPDWGFLYGEWSVGQNDFEKAFYVSTQELKKRAFYLGADAIVGMRQDIDLDTSGFQYFYLQMYGTAVRLKKHTQSLIK